MAAHEAVGDGEVEDDLGRAAVEPGGCRPVADEDGQRRLGAAVEERRHLVAALDRRGVPTRTAASSAVTAASGASSRSSRSKSPFLAAAMKASTTSQSAKRSSGRGWVTLARAREASLRAATGVVSRTAAMVGNSKPKLSWSTKATRSRGESRSSTTCRARPTVSASATSSAGSSRGRPRARRRRRGRGCGSAAGRGRAGWSRSSARPEGSRSRASGRVQPQPRLLHDVLGLGVVAEHPARDPHQSWSLGLEHVRLVHGVHPFTLLRHPTDARGRPGVTARRKRGRSGAGPVRRLVRCSRWYGGAGSRLTRGRSVRDPGDTPGAGVVFRRQMHGGPRGSAVTSEGEAWATGTFCAATR